MSFVLTVASQLTCTHQAQVALSSTAKLSVAGAKVLVLSDVVGARIIACTNPDSSSSKKCLVVATAAGTATKLTVGGQPAFTDTLAGTSDGAPPPVPLSLVSAGQAKLTAV